MAVASVGQPLERRVLQVAHPEAEHAQEHAALRTRFDQPREIALAGDTDVEIAIGYQDDAIRATADEPRRGLVVGELDSSGAIRRATGLQVIERPDDRILAI